MSFEAKERVRQATDIVDVIGGYMDLRRQGRMLVGLCPWHDDSKPSLQVNPERQSWKCWVCDDGGDIFSFVMKKEGVGFPEALKLLAEQAGIELDERRGPTATPGSPEDKATLYRAMAWAVEQFHRCLLYSDEAETARKYLQDRQIDADSISRYRIGFSPNQWRWIIDQGRPHGFSPEVLEAVGLAIKNEKANSWYDRFRGRVLFPISDTQKRPIAIGGRVLPEFADDKSPKYINSPETRLYSKSEQLYGLDVVRDQVAKQRHLVVMEGYTDVVVARQFGVDNVVAVCGTALGARHIPLIRRFADSITLVLDGDEAGQRRTNQILELFIASQMDLRIVTLPEGLDPCDFLQQQGFDAFQSFLQSAIDALEHKIRSTTAGLDLIRDTHKANVALNELLTTLARAPKSQLGKTDAANVLREQQVLVRLAREFQLDEQQLRKQLEEIRRFANHFIYLRHKFQRKQPS
ncbi:MAG: DNA primase [Pirellulaceae bacterium]